MHPRETGRRYDAIAPLWDEARRESAQGLSFLERAIALCKSRRMALDVGCGSGGRMLEKVLASGFRVTGIDVSSGMLQIANASHPTVEFVYADISDWVTPLRFDLIVAWDSTFHLPYELHAPVIGKLCACLAEQGVLLFTAGGIDGEIVGTMYGHEFAYSSLSDTELMRLLYRAGCVPILVERDQYPLHHLVVVAAKESRSAP